MYNHLIRLEKAKGGTIMMNDKNRLKTREKKPTDQKAAQNFYKAVENQIIDKPFAADFYRRAALPEAPGSWPQDFYRVQ